jgi:hypothetical protein
VGSNPTLAADEPKYSGGDRVSQPIGAASQRFKFSAAPPLRALAIASTCALAGAFLILIGNELHWPGLILVLSGVLLAFGIAFTVAVFVMVRRVRSVLLLDVNAITVVRGRRKTMLKWSDIQEVTLRGQRLVLVGRPGSRSAAVVNPPGSSQAVFAALVDAVKARLDDNRGYRQL